MAKRLHITEDRQINRRGNHGCFIAEVIEDGKPVKIGHHGITTYQSFRSQISKHCRVVCIDAVTLRERGDDGHVIYGEPFDYAVPLYD